MSFGGAQSAETDASYLPGESRNIENTIKPKTAAITNRAINIPLQFRCPGDDATNSCN